MRSSPLQDKKHVPIEDFSLPVGIISFAVIAHTALLMAYVTRKDQASKTEP